MFTEIPNKQYLNKSADKDDLWPDIGERCEVNLFFRKFSSAEGWLQKSYFMIWSKQEIRDLEPVIQETYSDKYHFFGSDGGGTQFAFFDDGGDIVYVSAPDIGSETDVRVLGTWQEFIKCIQNGDYI